MKKVESNSISSAFGLNELELDELYSVNGGLSSSIGVCINLGSSTLSGLVATPKLITLSNS